MSGQSIVTAEEDRFFGAQKWAYAAKTQKAWDGSITITESTTTQGVITGPAIDCSHFVYQAMLAAGYYVGPSSLSTSTLAGIVHGAPSTYYTNDTSPQVGDVIVFAGADGNGHAGIVTSYNATTGIVTFDNAQNSTKGLLEGQTCSAAVGSAWGSNDTVVGYLTVNASAYNPTAAASALTAINTAVDQGLYNAGLPTYFGSSITSSTVSSISSIVGTSNSFPLDADSSVESPWSTTITNTNGDDLKSTTYSYDASDNPTQVTENFVNGNSVTFAANTYTSLSYIASTNVLDATLATPNGISLGTLALNATTNSGTLTLANNEQFNFVGSSNIQITDPTETPEQVLLSYFGDLGDPMTAAQLDQANYNSLNPTGAAHTLVGNAEANEHGPRKNLTYPCKCRAWL